MIFQRFKGNKDKINSTGFEKLQTILCQKLYLLTRFNLEFRFTNTLLYQPETSET